VVYKGLSLDCGYQIDLIVQDEVVVELKAIEKVLPVHQAQLLTYLKLTQKTVGLLINFNVAILTQGISVEFCNGFNPHTSKVFPVTLCPCGEFDLYFSLLTFLAPPCPSG
jgi:hypothetical protein